MTIRRKLLSLLNSTCAHLNIEQTELIVHEPRSFIYLEVATVDLNIARHTEGFTALANRKKFLGICVENAP